MTYDSLSDVPFDATVTDRYGDTWKYDRDQEQWQVSYDDGRTFNPPPRGVGYRTFYAPFAEAA